MIVLMSALGPGNGDSVQGAPPVLLGVLPAIGGERGVLGVAVPEVDGWG